MNGALKMLVGIIIFVLGAWTMVNPSWFGKSGWIYGLNWWIYTRDIIKGSVGHLLIFIGLIIVWITHEDAKPYGMSLKLATLSHAVCPGINPGHQEIWSDFN